MAPPWPNSAFFLPCPSNTVQSPGFATFRRTDQTFCLAAIILSAFFAIVSRAINCSSPETGTRTPAVPPDISASSFSINSVASPIYSLPLYFKNAAAQTIPATTRPTNNKIALHLASCFLCQLKSDCLVISSRVWALQNQWFPSACRLHDSRRQLKPCWLVTAGQPRPA